MEEIGVIQIGPHSVQGTPWQSDHTGRFMITWLVGFQSGLLSRNRGMEEERLGEEVESTSVASLQKHE